MSQPESQGPIPIFVLAGALGSGKTTLMTKLARYCIDEGYRVGMVVNDFADLGVDAILLAEAGWPSAAVDSLNGACACCSEDTDLDSVLTGMVQLNRNVLLFETTGVADPADMLSQLLVPQLTTHYQIPRLVTVLDVTRYPDPLADKPRVQRQVSLADVIVLRMTDLVDEAGVETARQAAHAGNPWAPILDRELEAADLAAIVRLDANPDRGLDELLANGLLEHEHPHTLSLPLPDVLSHDRFEVLLRNLPPTILRAKGFVALDVYPTLHVFQYVEPGLVSIQPFKFAPRAGLSVASAPDVPFGIFIGTEIDEAWLRAELAACAAESAGVTSKDA